MSQAVSLNLYEDRTTIRKIIATYLTKSSVSIWKYEKAAQLLFDKGLKMKLIDNELKELGRIYLQEAQEIYRKNDTDEYSEDEKLKMETLPKTIDDISTSVHIKKIFYSNKIIDELDEHSINRTVQQQQNQNQAQTEMSRFKQMSYEDQMKHLCNKFGDNGHLDFMTDRIAVRFLPYLPGLMKYYKIYIQPESTRKEREMLLSISRCKTQEDIEELLSIFFSDKTIKTPMCRYIRLALAVSSELWSSGQLLTSDHNESWYRTHVYSAVWDNAFIYDKKFTSKRADCYSNITKEFDYAKNQCVDFILRNIDNHLDYLSAEEKPGLKGVKADLTKGKQLQILMLQKWKNQLGSINIISKFEAITCQWKGLKLTIFATRYISDEYSITYKKGTFMMPKEESHTAVFSKLLAAIISLKRLVLNNYTKLNTVLEAKHTYQIQTMQFEEENEYNLASDSTEGALDKTEYTNDTIDPFLEADISSALDNLENNSDEDIVNFRDWEEFLMERKRKLND